MNLLVPCQPGSWNCNVPGSGEVTSSLPTLVTPPQVHFTNLRVLGLKNTLSPYDNLAFAEYHLAESETLRAPACLDTDTGDVRRILEDGECSWKHSSLIDDHSRNFLGNHENMGNTSLWQRPKL